MIDGDTYFEIQDAGNYLRIKPIYRHSYNSSDHDWDKNWIKVNIEIKVGSFTGNFLCDFMTFDFESFYNQFVLLYDDLNGSLEFSNLENNLELKIKGDGIGHFKLMGLAYDGYMYGENKLSFRFDFDQTQIKEIEKGLYQIIKMYPKIET